MIKESLVLAVVPRRARGFPGWRDGRLGGDGAACDVGEGGHAELGAAVAAGGDLVHLGKLGAGAPARLLSVLRLRRASGPLRPQRYGRSGCRRSQRGGAARLGQGAAAGSAGRSARGCTGCRRSGRSRRGRPCGARNGRGNRPTPGLSGPVFPGGAQCPAAGNEGPVAVDDLFGVDRLISHGGVHVAVAGDQLAMCGGIPCMIASVMKILLKSWKV